MESDSEEDNATDTDRAVLLSAPQGTWGGGRLKVTGVRWAESVRRKKSHSEVTITDKKAQKLAKEEMGDEDFRITSQGGVVLRLDNRENARMVEMCYKTHTTLINPIIDWNDAEVWEFIHEYNIPYCCLYDEGFKRLGCIGCPMGSKEQRLLEFERWPKYKRLYMLAFEKMIANRGGTPKEYQNQTAEDIMQGYLTESFKGTIPNRGGW